MTDDQHAIEKFIADWRATGGSELANTQSFINGLCRLLDVEPPAGSRASDEHNDYVFERRVFQDNGDGTTSFGRIDCYKRDAFILESKQGSDADRTAATLGEEDLDLFGQTASVRLKRGTARRGTPGWARAMVQAKGQAERYAKALPTDHGWPPFLLVADIGYCMEIYADFTGTGKAYAQFPDRARYRVMLEDLRNEEVRDRLRSIWTDPRRLDPTARAARVTRDIANLLATVAKRIEKRGFDAEATSSFLMRVLFTMFAEDSELIPQGSFTQLLKNQRTHPQHLEQQLSALWAAMDQGEFSPALGVPLKKFNGYLFKNRAAIALDTAELDILIQAAEHVWTEVEPAIFGTLLERALNPQERAKLGAHYTPRAYVERLIGPTIMEPLRADWDGVRGAAATLIDDGKTDEARQHVEAFHARLAQTRVLDPACGTGNFLYVAMARMKELEGEVLDLLVELGDLQYVAEITGHTITPENFLGIEINPRAAAIAQLVLWIGYLQWHFRVNGKGRAPPEPILRNVRTIENRDALIDWDERVLERDEQGVPVTRWDGRSMKVNSVSGELVPDEDARVPVFGYVNPRATLWPKADFIVGNPPFIGLRNLRRRLDDQIIAAVRTAYPDVPENADWVMYWWYKAAEIVRRGQTRAFGLVTTKSISQSFARALVRPYLKGKDRLSFAFAVPNHPWVDDADGADVRIAMVTMRRGKLPGLLQEISSETGSEDGTVIVETRDATGFINARLGLREDVTDCVPLKSQAGLCSVGYQIGHAYLYVNEEEAGRLAAAGEGALLRENRATAHITQRRPKRYVIDAFGLSEAKLREDFPNCYQLMLTKRTSRAGLVADASDRTWWLFQRTREDFREEAAGLDRVIARPITAKHHIVILGDPGVVYDSSCVMFAFEDPYCLAILQSRIHELWFGETQGRMGVGDHPRYLKSDSFDSFPFPSDVPEALQQRLRKEGEALDNLRKRVLAEHSDLTLTKIYNVLEALREGRILTDTERAIHNRGLVTLLREHHLAIDALVREAYGWPTDVSDEEMLSRLVLLNRDRVLEEAAGKVRWIRPRSTQQVHRSAVTQVFDLGEVTTANDNKIAWPNTLPEQVSAVQQILVASPAPLTSQDVARAFKGKRATSLQPVLEALAGIGMARRLKDGRYAA